MDIGWLEGLGERGVCERTVDREPRRSRGWLGRQSRRVRRPTFSPTPANSESTTYGLLFHLFLPAQPFCRPQRHSLPLPERLVRPRQRFAIPSTNEGLPERWYTRRRCDAPRRAYCFPRHETKPNRVVADANAVLAELLRGEGSRGLKSSSRCFRRGIPRRGALVALRFDATVRLAHG